jgi:hypothetical protein
MGEQETCKDLSTSQPGDQIHSNVKTNREQHKENLKIIIDVYKDENEGFYYKLNFRERHNHRGSPFSFKFMECDPNFKRTTHDDSKDHIALPTNNQGTIQNETWRTLKNFENSRIERGSLQQQNPEFVSQRNMRRNSKSDINKKMLDFRTYVKNDNLNGNSQKILNKVFKIEDLQSKKGKFIFFLILIIILKYYF